MKLVTRGKRYRYARVVLRNIVVSDDSGPLAKKQAREMLSLSEERMALKNQNITPTCTECGGQELAAVKFGAVTILCAGCLQLALTHLGEGVAHGR